MGVHLDVETGTTGKEEEDAWCSKSLDSSKESCLMPHLISVKVGFSFSFTSNKPFINIIWNSVGGFTSSLSSSLCSCSCFSWCCWMASSIQASAMIGIARTIVVVGFR